VNYRNDIQGLRAIAVLLVIFSHVGVAGFAGGWIGVDVFFVISGFLITGLLIREYDSTNHVSLLQFYIRRAKRILPASLITIVVVLIASNLLLNSIRTANINSDAIWAVGFVSNIHFIRINTDYFTSGLAVSPLQHFWSLAVEEQFYLIWPALFLLISRQHGMRIRNWSISRSQRVLLIAVIASALSLMWSISYTNSNPTSAYFSTLTRVWELGFGVLLACTIPQIRRLTERWTDDERSVAFAAASWAGLTAIILGACVIIKPGDPFPGYLALIPVLGAVGIIFGGLAEKQPIPNRILSMQPLPFIGLISFSLYLWHWPVHVFADALYPDSVNTTVGILAQLVVILAISLVSYYLIENTTRHLAIGKKETTRKKFAEISKVPTAAITVMCVSAAFLFIVSNAAGGGRTDDAETSALSDVVTETPSTVQSQPAVTVDAVKAPQTITATQQTGPVLTNWKQLVTEASSVKSVSPEVVKLIESTANKPTYGLECDSLANIGCLNGSGSNVVALFGDSHATMIKSPLIDALPGWTLHNYQMGNCGWSTINFANPGQDRNLEKASLADCIERRDASFGDMLATRPKFIVLSDNAEWVKGQSQKQKDLWIAGLNTTLDRLSQLGPDTTIVIFGEVPRSNSFATCLRGNSIASCNFAPTVSRWLREEQRRAAASHPGVIFIDSEQWLCTDDTCPAVIDDTPVYGDGQHFTGVFNKKLGPLFKEALGL